MTLSHSIKSSLFPALIALVLAAMASTGPVAAQQPVPQQQSPQLPPMPGTPATPMATTPSEEKISIQFPHTSVAEVLTIYEKLTGKRLIRDSNLQGPELSILVADPIPEKEAISLIESSLLLNGYTLVPVDGKTMKILGPSRPPRSEGLPLYLEESQLPPDGDKIVSFYKQLKFLSPSEAISILQQVVQVNAYGSLVSIPNSGAIVITDKTPIIRKALALLDVVDHEPSQIITEFVPLQRANAEKIVETLNQMFGNGSTSGGGTPAPPGNQGAPGAVISSGGGDAHLLSGKAQFIADKRTNRVLMIVRADNYKYLRELISKLDQPMESDQPLVRPLNYLSVNELFPVLIDMLKGKDDTDTGSSGSTNGSASGARQQPTPQQSTTQSGTTGQTSGGVANTPDKLGEAAAQNPPESARVGSTSIISDAAGNSIIVYGPPESKAKASQIIDLLDKKPQQVYLAAVIGQLSLTEGSDYGASWFAKFNNGGSNGLVGAAVNNTLAGSLTNLVASSLNSAITNFPSNLTGLTVYGTIAQGVATYAHALESTGKFRTISRPVVYTVNNKKATIFSGQNVPIPGTSVYTPVASGTTSAVNSVTSTIQYQPVVLKLEVIPLINSDKEVNLTIAQHNDKLGAYSNIGGNQVPTILTQELTTTVRVPNGSTIVLGGLITDDKTTSDSGLPGLYKIPIIGPLLGGDSNKQRNRSELVIMIQPIVVDSNAAMEKASIEEGGDSELGRRAKGIKEKLEPTPSPTPKKKGFRLFSLPKIDNF